VSVCLSLLPACISIALSDQLYSTASLILSFSADSSTVVERPRDDLAQLHSSWLSYLQQ